MERFTIKKWRGKKSSTVFLRQLLQQRGFDLKIFRFLSPGIFFVSEDFNDKASLKRLSCT